MIGDPCCAHLNVAYQTEELPRGGTRGWWACECGKHFTPIANSLVDGAGSRPYGVPVFGADVIDHQKWLNASINSRLELDRYPQEIEEPSPAPSWWSRFMEWLG